MIDLPLAEWCAITATSSMPLYAVLSNVSDAQAVKHYYMIDGTQTPHGLCTGTPYSNWQSVMPMIVQLDEQSPFLDWINQTQYQDWGWLARSHLPFDSICAHLRGLTQVIMPSGETVFFRYWDGTYLTEAIRFMAERWAEVLPAFAFYLINGEPFTVHVPAESKPQNSPWWQVPQELIKYLLQKNQTPLLDNIIKYLQEHNPDIYFKFDQDILHKKIMKLLAENSINRNDRLIKKIIKRLTLEQ